MLQILKENNNRAKNIGMFLGNIVYLLGSKFLKLILIICGGVLFYFCIALVNFIITMFLGKDVIVLKKFSAFLIRTGFKNPQYGDFITIKSKPNQIMRIKTHPDGSIEDKHGCLYVWYNDEHTNIYFESITRIEILTHMKNK